MSAAPARIRTLEELSFNAWPALQTLLVDGWLLRFADGYTKRANSANAWRPGGTPPARIIEIVEATYRARGQRPIFRLSPLAPREADRLLARAGYAVFDATSVQTAPIAPNSQVGDVVVAESVDAAWLEGYAAATGLAARDLATLARMLRLVHLPCVFARIDGDDGVPIAFGYGVLERGHVGIFDVVTASAHRRRGLGRRIVGGLMGWGAARAADQAYLQVVGGNAPALALYRSLGFTEAYRYHYRLPAG